jgi:hypothetical protein
VVQAVAQAQGQVGTQQQQAQEATRVMQQPSRSKSPLHHQPLVGDADFEGGLGPCTWSVCWAWNHALASLLVF